MKYKIYDYMNDRYLDLNKYCINGKGKVMTTDGYVLSNQNVFKIETKCHNALTEIDNHIRSTKNPVPFIVETLKEILPEYKNSIDIENH